MKRLRSSTQRSAPSYTKRHVLRRVRIHDSPQVTLVRQVVHDGRRTGLDSASVSGMRVGFIEQLRPCDATPQAGLLHVALSLAFIESISACWPETMFLHSALISESSSSIWPGGNVPIGSGEFSAPTGEISQVLL